MIVSGVYEYGDFIWHFEPGHERAYVQSSSGYEILLSGWMLDSLLLYKWFVEQEKKKEE